jgi:hypothetical protein
MIDAARVYIADAAERVEHEAKRAIAAVHQGDMLLTQMAVLKRFGKRPAVWLAIIVSLESTKSSVILFHPCTHRVIRKRFLKGSSLLH